MSHILRAVCDISDGGVRVSLADEQWLSILFSLRSACGLVNELNHTEVCKQRVTWISTGEEICMPAKINTEYKVDSKGLKLWRLEKRPIYEVVSTT